MQWLFHRTVLVTMPRSQLTKIDIQSRVLRMKDLLYNGTYGREWSIQQKEAADKALSDVLDILDEYRY